MSKEATAETTAIATRSPFDSHEGIELAMRKAKCFSQSGLVPAHFRGKPADCLVAIDLARNLGVPELTLMQETGMVHGNPYLSARMRHALVRNSGKMPGRLRYRTETLSDQKIQGRYPDIKVTAYIEGEDMEATVSMQEAVDDGWTSNKKYLATPERMLRNRAITLFMDLFYPELVLGLPTFEEAELLPPAGQSGGVGPLSEEDILGSDVVDVEPEPALPRRPEADRQPTAAVTHVYQDDGIPVDAVEVATQGGPDTAELPKITDEALLTPRAASFTEAERKEILDLPRIGQHTLQALEDDGVNSKAEILDRGAYLANIPGVGPGRAEALQAWASSGEDEELPPPREGWLAGSRGEEYLAPVREQCQRYGITKEAIASKVKELTGDPRKEVRHLSMPQWTAFTEWVDSHATDMPRVEDPTVTEKQRDVLIRTYRRVGEDILDMGGEDGVAAYETGFREQLTLHIHGEGEAIDRTTDVTTLAGKLLASQYQQMLGWLSEEKMRWEEV